MILGPAFSRELAIAPRRVKTYVARATYAAALLVLICTGWLVLAGTQLIRDVGDMARFGAAIFQVLAPLQLVVVVFFSATAAASAMALEKDRQTLTLLLLTQLSNRELILGGWMASLVTVWTLLAAGAPVFLLSALFGGISFEQIGRVYAVTIAAVFVCGSLGSTLGLWREKTYQAIASTVLAVVLWVAAGEVIASGTLGGEWLGLNCRDLAAAFSPWHAVLVAADPFLAPKDILGLSTTPVPLFLSFAGIATVALNALAIFRIRAWCVAAEPRVVVREEAKAAPAKPAAVGPARPVWDNPILWREIRTSAYGRKMLLVRLAYCVIFGFAAAHLYSVISAGLGLSRDAAATALVPIFLLSLVLINAQAVTSITAERDVRALDLLLVTDLTPIEVIFGKLGGVFYNAKEMVALPILLCLYLGFAGEIDWENVLFLLGGLSVMFVFAAVLGLHAGMTYANSRTAVAASLGTMFFLLVGVATCMYVMIAFSGSFQAQLHPFLAFMVGGGLGLYVVLGARNPSTAIGIASFACPVATFYAAASFLMNYTVPVFLVGVGAYGFMAAAMLVPAIYEFDVATGRTTVGEE